MNAGPSSLRRGGKSARKAQRVYRAAAWIKKRVDVSVRADHGGSRSGAEELKRYAARSPLTHRISQCAQLRFVVRGTKRSGTFRFAIDPAAVDQTEQIIRGFRSKSY